MSEKKNIIIGGLIGIIILLLGFIVYLIYNSNKQDTKNKDAEVITITDEHALQKLTDLIRIRKNFDLVEKLPDGYTKDFADWQKIALAMVTLDRSLIFNFGIDNNGYIGADTFFMMAKQLFGKDLTYKDDNYKQFESIHYDFSGPFIYNKESKQYVVNNYLKLYVGDDNFMFTYVPYKLEKKDNEYYLYVYRVYMNYVYEDQKGKTKYYKDRNKKELVYELPATDYRTSAQLRKDFINLDKEHNLVKTKYTFKKETANYVWIKYETLK